MINMISKVLLSEVKEIIKESSKEIAKKTKAFENSIKEVGHPKRISTYNEGLEGKKHPVTNVEFRKNVFRLEGEKVEGVFPRFESNFETRLPKNLWKASDGEQFSFCTEKLKHRIENDPSFAKMFTPRQIEQIKADAPRISGLTWHHNEVPGKMQLVNSDIHQKTNHTGGRTVWGGGNDCR